MNNNVAAKYDLRNQSNNRVPGLNNGVASFKSNKLNINTPNAMIAPEEGVVDGITGRISTVPGIYNKSNPDVVPANLTQGTSIYSKNSKYTIPGGKSTPADVVARAEKMQSINDKIMNPKVGERKLSSIDKRTAELNKLNINKQLELLNMNTTLQQQMSNFKSTSSKLPAYDKGLNGTYELVPAASNNTNSNVNSNAYKSYVDSNGTLSEADFYKQAKFEFGDGSGKLGRWTIGDPTESTTVTFN